MASCQPHPLLRDIGRLMPVKFAVFSDALIKRCKYWDLLDPIMSDRTATGPLFVASSFDPALTLSQIYANLQSDDISNEDASSVVAEDNEVVERRPVDGQLPESCPSGGNDRQKRRRLDGSIESSLQAATESKLQMAREYLDFMTVTLNDA